MLTKEQFAAIRLDMIASQDFIQIVHESDPTTTFVCHHNAYLVAAFLKRVGHDCRWDSGYYRCNSPAPSVRHSWVAFYADNKTILICEFDPRQLFDRGGYANDPMPSGEIPELEIRITPIAIIVDPAKVELPSDPDDLRFVVQSYEVLGRYIRNDALAPDLDFERLDDSARKSQVYYAKMLEESNNPDQD